MLPKSARKKLARERILELFRQADRVFAEDALLSARYVELALKLSSRHKVRMPRELKRRFCKHCGAFFVHGRSVRARLHRGKLVLTCLQCQKYTRVPYHKQKRVPR